MFSDAIETAKKFTHPIICAFKTIEGKSYSPIGAYILLNDDGWILTVAHIFNPIIKQKNDESIVKAYLSNISDIESDDSLTSKQKNKKKSKLKIDQNCITDYITVAECFGSTHAIEKITIDPELDLAIAQIKDYDAPEDFQYPSFKKSEELRQGKSLCKLGFPFNTIEGEFINEGDKKIFGFKDKNINMTFFPMDGIITRNINLNKTKSGYERWLIETSTPGLRGQSGGPIFDDKGVIWGVQSATKSIPLGFTPIVRERGKETVENQFINLGIGVHPISINQFLERNKISYKTADY